MSLRESLKQSLLDLVLASEPVKKYCKSVHPLDLNKILLLDERSVPRLKELMRPSELTALGYASTQPLTTALQPTPLHLIYCFEPADDNFTCVKSVLSKNPCPFKTVHIFCLGRISDSQIQILKSDPKILSKLVTLREVPLTSCLVFGDLAIFDVNFRIPYLYDISRNKTRIEDVSNRMIDVFKVCNDKPAIRYFRQSAFARDTANAIFEKLKELEKSMPNLGRLGNENTGFEARQSVCLIVDRSYDTLVPFIHDLTFESMIFDLLDVKGTTVEVMESGQSFKYDMLEEDALWNDLRHKHIANILNQVSTTVKDFTLKNKIKVPEGASVSELRKIISKFPAIMPEFAKLQALFVVASKLMEIYKERNLREIIATEQDFASNAKDDGEPISDNFALYYSLMEDIQSPDDKLRLISLFALKNNRGLSLALVEKLLKMSGVDAAKQFIEALKAIDFPIVEESGVTRDEIIRVPEDPEIAIGYNDSRFVPQIWGLVKNILGQNLNQQKFPFVGDAVTISFAEESQKKNFEGGKYSKKVEAKPKKNKPRIYLVFLGGVCHAELRCIRVAQKLYPQCEIINLASEVFTPKTFISHLKSLKS